LFESDIDPMSIVRDVDEQKVEGDGHTCFSRGSGLPQSISTICRLRGRVTESRGAQAQPREKRSAEQTSCIRA
jgi:hypothetical protein